MHFKRRNAINNLAKNINMKKKPYKILIKMDSKAYKEIKEALPYIKLLCERKLSKKLKHNLLLEAPSSVFSVTTQISRHILNGTFSEKLVSNKFIQKFKNSLYLFALHDTKRINKIKILELEYVEFLNEILKIILQEIYHNNEQR